MLDITNEAVGVLDKAKLEELGATNVALLKERDELTRRFEWIDLDEARMLAGD